MLDTTGIRLSFYRRRARITQQKLGKLIGSTEIRICRLETDRASMLDWEARKISEVLQIDKNLLKPELATK